jgi:Tfp pilus assembly protein PilX
MMARIQARLRRMRDTLRGTMGAERGMALMLVLMIMMLLSALMIGFMASIMADQKLSGVDRDETQAYAVAHAGMEKLTSDLAALFTSDYSPSGAQISTIASHAPVIAGFTYTDPDGTNGYKVQFTTSVSGVNTPVSTPTTAIPIPDDPTTGTTIAAGPYQGFKGLVTHYNIMVTARSSGGSEVRMRRELQTVAVPVFQFGMFSESSLSFHAGADFNFGGRVHTNGNLFLTSGTGWTLIMGDKVTAVGEIVRKYLDNGILATTGWGGVVSMAKGTGVYRSLLAAEGSVVDNLGSALNDPTWTNLSVGTYNGYIRNGRTGAKRLDLPLVAYGALPIDLIRRPPPPVAGVGENDSKPLVYAQRYYSQASLRIMLSDTAADMTLLPQVTGPAISLEAVAGVACANPLGCFGPVGKKVPLATAGTLPAGTYKSSAGTPLIGGFIKIDLQKADGTWIDATPAILALGIAGRNLSTGVVNVPFTAGSARNGTLNTCLAGEATGPSPNAVIRLQRVKDVPSTDAVIGSGYDCAVVPATGVPVGLQTDYWPLALYDTREAVKRDEAGAIPTTSIVLGGVMYYVELDTNNLAKWFLGAAAPFNDGIGTQAKNDNNGYIVYFSDRRNNRNAANAETGELGNEDIINWATAAGTANGVLDAGEDVNAYVPVAPAVYTPVLDTYGTLPNQGTGTANDVPGAWASPLHSGARVNNVIAAANLAAVSLNASIMRGNRPIFFRRALKLTGGSALRTSGITGLTIASENPVYVQGDYNVGNPANFATETHIAAAVIADAIVLLSNAWNDINSFYPTPNGVTGNVPMNATTTSYRLAAVAGKSISFTRPTNWTPETDFGDDGGAHNLMRLLDDWGGQTMNYRGSIVSFYISRQATGIYKSGAFTYGAPGTRAFSFDTDFLLPDKLPPGTPMFRDVNTLTFRQLLRPNQ